MSASHVLIDGDEFERIVASYQDRLKAFVKRVTRSREDAEEVVQDTFLRAYRSLNAMAPERRRLVHLRSWLFTIARNAALNHMRRRRDCPSLDAFDALRESKLIDCRTPESIVVEHEGREEIQERLRLLPPHLREEARLRFLEDRSLSQIADACGKPLGTVKSHVYRAVLSLRRSAARVA